METKTIKVSKKNYEWLCEIAGKLQEKEKTVISIDEAISKLRSSTRISDLAGAWKMNDKEAKRLLADIRKRWVNWKVRYA